MSSEVPPSGCTTKWLLRLRGVCNIGNKEVNAPCRFPVTVCPTGYGTTTTFLDTTEMPDLNMDMELELSPAESLAIWKVVLLAALALLFIGILAICLIRWMVKHFKYTDWFRQMISGLYRYNQFRPYSRLPETNFQFNDDDDDDDDDDEAKDENLIDVTTGQDADDEDEEDDFDELMKEKMLNKEATSAYLEWTKNNASRFAEFSSGFEDNFAPCAPALTEDDDDDEDGGQKIPTHGQNLYPDISGL